VYGLPRQDGGGPGKKTPTAGHLPGTAGVTPAFLSDRPPAAWPQDRVRTEVTGHDRPARVAPRPNIDSLVKEQTNLESARVNRRREEQLLGNSEKS